MVLACADVVHVSPVLANLVPENTVESSSSLEKAAVRSGWGALDGGTDGLGEFGELGVVGSEREMLVSDLVGGGDLAASSGEHSWAYKQL